MESKPPRGVMKKDLFEEHRILDLTRAIYEHVGAGLLKENHLLIKEWSKELNERICCFEASKGTAAVEISDSNGNIKSMG